MNPDIPWEDQAAFRKAERARKLREWKKDNPDKVRSYWNSEKGRATRDAYYNSEVGKASRARSYIRNFEKTKERNRVYRNTPKGKEYSRLYNISYYSNPDRRMHKLLLVARMRSKKDEAQFDDCVFNEVKENIPEICPCCKNAIDFKFENKRKLNAPSLDRVDNLKGYVSGNVRIICFGCNVLKANGSIQDFENIIAYMRSVIG